ncbi:OLC1v1018591C1 [Oldenlandia corymbosa var. corymbosa]|uniref:OLC1v1018591C1 n=1 Tax=Oldenlandia corymbosa var. corymbosa TaxID=529605 RepID=A0AAV1ECC5_OLDCO|nr:OLC1v1018591C1 [Oldenlandia corymbosa var. corymbosa]
MLDNMFINLSLEKIGQFRRVSKAWEEMTKRQEFVLQKREMSYPASENNILVFTQTSQEDHLLQDKLIATNIKAQMDNPCNHIRFQEEMSMGDDGIHKIMPITTDLICLQTSSQIKFLNPKTTQLATVEWPYDVPFSNCETTFGYVSSSKTYIFMALIADGKNMQGCIFSFQSCSRIHRGEWKTLCNVCPRLVSDGIWFDRFVYWRVDKLSSKIATPQELLVVFDYHTQQFQPVNCPPSPTFFNPTYPSHMNLQVKILDFQGTMCVIDEYEITQNYHCEMWAWDPDTSTWDCIFETHEFPNVNTHVPQGLHFRHDWLYPVFLSHKSSPAGQFIVKGYDNRHLLLYSVPTRKITHSSISPDLETSFIIRACYFWETLTHF